MVCLIAIFLFPTVFLCRLEITIPVMVNPIGARGAHTRASPMCLDRLRQKWREELGTEGLLNDDEGRSEARMLFSLGVVPNFLAGNVNRR